MLFNSLAYVAFLVAILVPYYALSHRMQNRFLLVASYFFYGCWDWRFLSLILLSTIIDFFVGQRLGATEDPQARRRLVIASLVSNLGILGTFKYLGFFADSLAALAGNLGVELGSFTLEVVLPVGISFYTFQTLSYTIDIYRRQLEPSRNFLDFALYVSFFPQLVAGPIERATQLMPQVVSPRTTTPAMVREGIFLLLTGYYKKVVLADNVAPIAARVFENPESVHGFEVLIGIYAFAFQIYGDFSGYTDIARGTARLFGFKLMRNFEVPYYSVTPSEFWRRWHISLSSWLRDYLYISLGGNRHGVSKTYRNLMLTMLLGGLWHGAAWNFVAWGAFHGALLCIHRAIFGARHAPDPTLSPRRLFHAALFFQVTCVGWVLFAVRDLSGVGAIATSLVTNFEFNGLVSALDLLLFATPVVALDLARLSSPVAERLPWSRPVRLAIYASLFALIVLCGRPAGEEFIYFQF